MEIASIRTISEGHIGPACPGLHGANSKQMLVTHTLLQSLLHVEESVGKTADFSHDLGAQLLMVLEHSVHIKCHEVLGHAAYI